MTAGTAPTDAEQYMLELINRARANPAAEGQRLLALAQTDPVIHQATSGWNLNLFYQTISSYAPEPPLAFNPRLIDAALAEDASMLAANSQNHSPSGFLNNPKVATDTDGQAYFPTGTSWWATGENIFAFSANVTGLSLTNYVDYFEAGFLLDWGNPDFGHLKNILAPGPAEANTSAGIFPFNQVGVGLLAGTPTAAANANPANPANAGINVGPELVTQEFGWTQGSSFLTGTFYTDNAGTGFYQPGEGLGGVTITAVGTAGQGTFRTQTWSSGGYSLQLPAGTYQVAATGGGLPSAQSKVVTIGQDNVGWEIGFKPSQQADIPVPGDYDGVGHAEFATYQPANGTWTIDSPTGIRTVYWGIPGDVPVPGYYDGGTKLEIAVYRPSIGTWFILSPTGVKVVYWGIPGDVPVPGDYNGDGRTDFAVYRPSIGTWFIKNSATQAVQVQPWGYSNLDQPVQAAYDGGGVTEIAVFRPTTDQWFILAPTGVKIVTFGTAGSIPVPAPYDGGGKAEIAAYQPSTSTFSVWNTGVQQVLGVSGLEQPVVGDFDGDGKSDFGVYQPSSSQWLVMGSKGGTIQATVGKNGVAQTIKSVMATAVPIPSAWSSWVASAGAESAFGLGPIPLTTVQPPAAPLPVADEVRKSSASGATTY